MKKKNRGKIGNHSFITDGTLLECFYHGNKIVEFNEKTGELILGNERWNTSSTTQAINLWYDIINRGRNITKVIEDPKSSLQEQSESKNRSKKCSSGYKPLDVKIDDLCERLGDAWGADDNEYTTLEKFCKHYADKLKNSEIDVGAFADNFHQYYHDGSEAEGYGIDDDDFVCKDEDGEIIGFVDGPLY